MSNTTIGRGIGLASLVFGTADVLFGDRFAKAVGSGTATGAAGVTKPAGASPIRGRFAGDVIDLAGLVLIAARPNPRRKAAIATLALVAVVAAIDFVAARTKRGAEGITPTRSPAERPQSNLPGAARQRRRGSR